MANTLGHVVYFTKTASDFSAVNFTIDGANHTLTVVNTALAGGGTIPLTATGMFFDLDLRAAAASTLTRMRFRPQIAGWMDYYLQVGGNYYANNSYILANGLFLPLTTTTIVYNVDANINAIGMRIKGYTK